MINGLDLLAGAKYPKEVIRSKGFALGFFAETFGDAYPVIESVIKAGCKLVRVHLIWSDTHQFGDKDIPKIKKLAAKYNQLANKYPAIDLRLSPFCEHNISNPDKYLDICQSAAPNCLVVNTPWKGGFSKKYINEIHGIDNKKPEGRYHISLDGTEATNCDMEGFKKRHADAEVMFLWSARFNLKWSMKDTTPRPQRNALPTKEYIDSIACLFNDKGNYNLPKNWLVKSHAEKHDKIDTKGDKLLIISPIKANSISLKRNGKEVAKLGYYGTFDGGGYRYYWNRFGYAAGGNLDVFINNKKYGVINAGFRSPPYR